MHADRGTIDIKQDFSQNAHIQLPWLNLGGRARAKVELFQNMVIMHIQLKPTMHAATLLQIFCPQTYPQPRGLGQNVKTFLSESNHVAYTIEGVEHRAPLEANIRS